MTADRNATAALPADPAPASSAAPAPASSAAPAPAAPMPAQLAPTPPASASNPALSRRIDTASLIICAGIAVSLCVMLGRVVQLQVAPGVQLSAMMSDRRSTLPEPARRGDVLDRRGRVLAATRFGQRLFLDPTRFADDPTAELMKLSEVLGVPIERLGEPLAAAMARNQRAIDTALAATPPKPSLWARLIGPRTAQANASPIGADSAPNATPHQHSASSTHGADALADPTPVPGAEVAADSAPVDPNSSPDLPIDPATLANGRGNSAVNSEPATPADPTKPRLIRYLRIRNLPNLTDAQAEALRTLKLPGVGLERVQVREILAADTMAPLLGIVGTEDRGMMGFERAEDRRMQPKAGSLTYVRDAWGRPLWLEPGGFKPPERGGDTRLSFDLELQRMAFDELERGVIEADAQGGRIVLMDPNSGEIVAMVDIVRDVRDAVPYDWKSLIPKDKKYGGGAWGPRYRVVHQRDGADKTPAKARVRCVEDIYEPGSTFKPFMWSAVTELGLASPTEIFDTHHGEWQTPYGRWLRDVVKKPSQTWADVLINSSNIGMAQGTARMAFNQMHDAVVKFGFGSRTNTGLDGESAGLVTALVDSRGKPVWSKYTHTSVAMGHEVAVTPVQMVRAFSVFARIGDEAGTLPILRMTAVTDRDPVARVISRVLPRQTAELARETMRGVTSNLDRRLMQNDPPEGGWKYELFGKSGTAEIPLVDVDPPRDPQTGKAKPRPRPRGSDGYFRGQYNASFIAAGPVESPRLVCLVVIDDPGPELIKGRRHYGSVTAGPVVRRVMDRALAYLGTPASPTMLNGTAPTIADHPD